MVCEGRLGGRTCRAFDADHWLSAFGDCVTRLKALSCHASHSSSRVIGTEKQAMNLEDFVRDENIRRYRRILKMSKDETERQTVLKLLTEEIAQRNNKTGPKPPDLAE